MIYDANLVVLTLPRDVLYERINKRVDVMMENGLKEEMDCLYESRTYKKSSKYESDWL